MRVKTRADPDCIYMVLAVMLVLFNHAYWTALCLRKF